MAKKNGPQNSLLTNLATGPLSGIPSLFMGRMSDPLPIPGIAPNAFDAIDVVTSFGPPRAFCD
jgi:hypothetical protein